MKALLWIGVAVGVGAVLYHFSLLRLTMIVSAYVTAAGLGVWFGMARALVSGKQYKPSTDAGSNISAMNVLLKSLMESKANAIPDQRKVVISRSMDLAIQEFLDLVQRDFVLTWYTQVGQDEKNFVTLLQNETWLVIEELSSRLSRIDWVRFITQTVVTTLDTHFRDVRFAAKRPKDNEPQMKFILHPCMENEASQTEFLRKICDVLLVVLLPTRYSTFPSARHLLREILTLSVVQPTITMICDPDYINQKLLGCLEYREKLSEDTRKTYTYAATYEDFMKMIEKCEDIEHLKQIRFNIITEIMQATTISNLKRAKGIDTGKESSPKGTAKGDLLKARNLKRYINQLTVAKSRCEKLIHSQGGPDYKYYTEGSDGDGVFPGQKVLSFSVIMDTPAAREHFIKYLRKDDNESLLKFWIGVENLKSADKKSRHQIASDLYQRFIASPASIVKTDIKTNLKAMESFLLGNGGPDAFYSAQKQVQQVLEEKHYPSFIVSDTYHRYITSVEDSWDAESSASKDELSSELRSVEGEGTDDATAIVSQSFHAQQLLEQLSEKISNKMHALHALKSSQKADEKMTKLRVDMEQELESLKLERRQLEFHIERTDVWCENVGAWHAAIHTAESMSEGDKLVPYFVIIVHLPGGTVSPSHMQRPGSEGWVVSRSLNDFHSLHIKLLQIGSWLRKKELPTLAWFRTLDSAFLDKAKLALQDYLEAVLKDDRMIQSEALYAFLTPTPEYLKQTLPEKKSRFFLANLFKSNPSSRESEGDGYGDLLFAGDESSKEDRSKDSIAEPLYGLIREVFELSGMFKWLRKSFIVFVEVTFGRSINRQLRETVDWILSESMLIYYIQLFRESMWPDGQLAEPFPARTDAEKLETRLKAKQKLLNSMPDAVKSLVGDTNTRQGAIKMFEVLQNIQLNKHLVYTLLQQFLEELIPELNQNPTGPNQPEPLS